VSHTTANSPDPITLEIIHNALRSITDEIFIALMKSAYSTNIKERHDHSGSLMDARGRLVAQSEQSLPVHLASMKGLVDSILAKYGLDEIHAGDIFIGNDPYAAGGTHLPDVNMAMPIYFGDRIAGWACNIAHHADIGGATAGSLTGGVEIYQEGLRIPVMRLFEKGQLHQELMDMLLLNVRIPEERRGDYFAQVAACRLGERRLRELLERHGLDLLERAYDEIIARTEMRMRAAFAEIPDGVYSFVDYMDGDGPGFDEIAIRAKIEVRQKRIRVDFAGSSKQVASNINCTMNATQSAVCYALKALLDPDIPNNQGVMDSIEIAAPEGSIVNSVSPAAVAARSQLCQRIIDVMFGALADALPKQVVGAANGANTVIVLSGHHPKTGKPYVYLETLGGGFGGRSTKDGKDGVQVHITNTSNLPVEAIEMEYPLLVEAYELIPDTGGAGRFRGGLGMRRVIGPIGHTAKFSGQGERFHSRPWGVFGGQPGTMGGFALIAPDGTRTPLPSKPADIALSQSWMAVVETPGAGGYGQPADRDREAILTDERSGKYSPDYLRKYYGF
jgi:N-methylhydantoinase B